MKFKDALSRVSAVVVLVFTVPVIYTAFDPQPAMRLLQVSDAWITPQAIVPLSGGPQRVRRAAELFHEHRIPSLVLTRPVAGVSYLAEASNVLQGLSVPRAQVQITPETADSTYAEALNVRRLAEKNRWTALVVVTDKLHTRRARLIFREVFRDSGIQVAVVDAPPATTSTRAEYAFMRSEYGKLVLFFCGYHRWWHAPSR